MRGSDLGLGDGSGLMNMSSRRMSSNRGIWVYCGGGPRSCLSSIKGKFVFDYCCTSHVDIDNEVPFNPSTQKLLSHPRATSETSWPQAHSILLLLVRNLHRDPQHYHISAD